MVHDRISYIQNILPPGKYLRISVRAYQFLSWLGLTRFLLDI